MTPEGKLKAECRKIAKANGLIFWNHEGKGINGIPDTICGKWPVGSGIINLEAKRSGQEPSEQQYKRIHEIREAGGEADWYDSVERYKQLVGLL